MFANYLLYLKTLTELERTNQLTLIIVFFSMIVGISVLLAFLKYKYEDRTKNKAFKKFLQKI